MSEKTIAFRVDEKLHRDIKMRLAETGYSLKDYVITLIKDDLYANPPVYSKTIPLLSGEINEDTVKSAQKIVDFMRDYVEMQKGKK